MVVVVVVVVLEGGGKVNNENNKRGLGYEAERHTIYTLLLQQLFIYNLGKQLNQKANPRPSQKGVQAKNAMIHHHVFMIVLLCISVLCVIKGER